MGSGGETDVGGLEGSLKDLDCVILSCYIAKTFRTTLRLLDLPLRVGEDAHTISQPRAVIVGSLLMLVFSRMNRLLRLQPCGLSYQRNSTWLR